MQSLLKTELVDTQSGMKEILPVDQIPAKFRGLQETPRGLDWLDGTRLIDDLEVDPAFVNEPREIINRNGATMEEFVDIDFFGLWGWLYPNVKVPVGEEREKLRDHVRVAAYLKSVQDGITLAQPG